MFICLIFNSYTVIEQRKLYLFLWHRQSDKKTKQTIQHMVAYVSCDQNGVGIFSHNCIFINYF